jgi:hypothetical protein
MVSKGAAMRRLGGLNLRDAVTLAVSNMYGSLDERREYLPFFTYRLFDDPMCLVHGTWDSPHVVGRYLYAFSWARRAFDLPIEPEIVSALARRLYASLEIGRTNGMGMVWNEETGAQPPGAWGHNLREGLLGLLAVHDLQHSPLAMERAAVLVRDIARHCGGSGVLPGAFLDERGWQPHPILGAAPAQSGRLIRALVEYHRLTDDAVALDLARELADYNCRQCFADDGTWTAAAGTHVHSITGTIASLLELGFALRQDRYVTAGRRAFDQGLKPYRSSFGWVKEMRDTPNDRGEANNSADALQSALLLGKHLDPTYYADAEKILRNHLVASQFVCADWFTEKKGGNDTPQSLFRGVARRALGGFCFSSPADFKSHEDDRKPINTDLVGGATHGISEAYHHAWDDDGTELRVHLLVSRKSPIGSIRSAIPDRGHLEIDVQHPRIVFVRIPEGVSPREVRLLVDGAPTPPVVERSYLRLGDRPRRTHAVVDFPLKDETRTEILNGKEYRVHWSGETVTSIEAPRQFFKPLY